MQTNTVVVVGATYLKLMVPPLAEKPCPAINAEVATSFVVRKVNDADKVPETGVTVPVIV